MTASLVCDTARRSMGRADDALSGLRPYELASIVLRSALKTLTPIRTTVAS